jgi:hypothetical protein
LRAGAPGPRPGFRLAIPAFPVENTMLNSRRGPVPAMPVTFFTRGEDCYDAAIKALTDDVPLFLSRIGGSDTDAVVDYLMRDHLPPEKHEENNRKNLTIVKRYNGYYDQTNNPKLYSTYLETLMNCYRSSRHAMFCNNSLICLYFQDFVNHEYAREVQNKIGFQALVGDIISKQKDATFYPYHFVERIVFDSWVMFRLFTKILQGKKVLVLSPFGESIVANFHNRHSFFRYGYQYPEFDLIIYNTPITYDGLPKEYYPHKNWFETTNKMMVDVAAIDFDIALLCCGSYAMPLGTHIEQNLERKAIYVGGVLQLFFGIMGRRYQNSWFLDQINVDKYIYPLNRDRYLSHVQITDQTAPEAFGAYF